LVLASRADLGERWPSRLVATASRSRLSIKRNLYTSVAALSGCRINSPLETYSGYPLVQEEEHSRGF
jgi:hypothetical protein